MFPSINQIDQEDCFSWEEDNLSLAINTDKPTLDMTAGLASSFKDAPMLERTVSGGSQLSQDMQDKGISEEKGPQRQESSNAGSPGMHCTLNSLSEIFTTEQIY